jgi:cytochrome d ubiquinol oxidase subunit II
MAPALLFGVAFGNIARGVPLDADHEFTGTLLTLLNPYALLGGLATLSLFALHGATFLALKTHGDVRVRANALVPRIGVPAIVLGGTFLIWTFFANGVLWTGLPVLVAAGALVAAVLVAIGGREGWAFVLTAAAIVAVTVALFGTLYPDVLPSSTNPAFSLTTTNASSTPYTLTIMSWVALAFTPIVLAYQAWTFWVFRRRVSPSDIPAPTGLAPVETTTAVDPTAGTGAHAR